MSQLRQWAQETQQGGKEYKSKYEAEECFLRTSVVIQLVLAEPSTSSKLLEYIVNHLSPISVLVLAEMKSPTLDFTGDTLSYEVVETTLEMCRLALLFHVSGKHHLPWLTIEWVGQLIAIIHENLVVPKQYDQLQSIVNVLLASSQRVCNMVTTHTLALNWVNQAATTIHPIYCFGTLFANTKVVSTFIASKEFRIWLDILQTQPNPPSEEDVPPINATFVACIGFPEISYFLLTSEHPHANLFRMFIHQLDWSDSSILDDNIPSIWLIIVRNMLTSLDSVFRTLVLTGIQIHESIQGVLPIDFQLLQLQFLKSRYCLGTSKEVSRPFWCVLDAPEHHSVWNSHHQQPQCMNTTALVPIGGHVDSDDIQSDIMQSISKLILKVKKESTTKETLDKILAMMKEVDQCTQVHIVGELLVSPSRHSWTGESCESFFDDGERPRKLAMKAWKMYCDTVGIVFNELRLVRSTSWDWGTFLWSSLEPEASMGSTYKPPCLLRKTPSELQWITHGVEVILSRRRGGTVRSGLNLRAQSTSLVHRVYDAIDLGYTSISWPEPIDHCIVLACTVLHQCSGLHQYSTLRNVFAPQRSHVPGKLAISPVLEFGCVLKALHLVDLLYRFFATFPGAEVEGVESR